MKTIPLVALMTVTIVSLISTVAAESIVNQWETRYEGPASSYDSATAVATDKAGNVFVVGSSRGSTTGDDYYTAK